MLDGEDEDLILDTPVDEDEVEDAAPAKPAEDDDDDIVFEVEGDDSEPEVETPAIRQIREQLRKEQKRNAELERRLVPQTVEVGPKPDLYEDCEGDPDKFEAALTSWQERKRKQDDQTRQQTESQAAMTRRFEASQAAMRAEAARFNRADFQEAEQSFSEAFPQLNAIVPLYFKERAPLLMLTLKDRPALMEKMKAAAEADPLAAAFELWDLSKGIKVNRKKPPEPEASSIQRGSASLATSTDKTLEKLEKEAERTNDRSKVVAYKRTLRNKAA